MRFSEERRVSSKAAPCWEQGPAQLALEEEDGLLPESREEWSGSRGLSGPQPTPRSATGAE